MIQRPSEPGCYLARVVHVASPCREHFLLTLRMVTFPSACPGQFVQLLCRTPERSGSQPPPDAPDPLDFFESDVCLASPMLRRPFSIAGLRRSADGSDIDVLGRVIGAGTAWLASRRAGDLVDVLGPLGRGFTPPADGATALLVAGGVGLPPVRWWAESLRRRGVACCAIFGAQTRALLPVEIIEEPRKFAAFSPCIAEFARDGVDAIVTTDDGTCGMKGRVTDALADVFRRDGGASRWAVYACGPEAMLESVAQLCEKHDVPCELALERVMGCGLATCQSCVVPVRDEHASEGWRYALCCTEGPVFDARRVLWSHGNVSTT